MHFCRWLNLSEFTRILRGPNRPKICVGRTKPDFEDLAIHSDFANLLLGDEGEGEPLVASPPCAADSVQSVQREQTSPPTKSLLLLYFQC